MNLNINKIHSSHGLIKSMESKIKFINRDILIEKMLEFYEINLPQEKISEIIEKTKGKGAMVQNMYEAALLPWALSTNFRSGEIGGWKNEFTENNKKNFKNLIGNFLIELGYEKNNDW